MSTSTDQSNSALGFVGAGAMGRGMVRSLARAGFRVSVTDIDSAALATLENIPNVTLAAGPCELGGCSTVITMLPSERATENVAIELASTLPANAVHIMMATIGPALADTLHAQHGARNQRFVAAPVFGRPDEAAAGDLTVVAGGPVDASVAAVLRAMGPRLHVLGLPRQACVVKLAGNGLIGAAIAALAESFALIAANDIDAATFHDVVTAKLFQGPVYKGVGTMMTRNDIEPPNKFTAALARKDIALLTQCHALAGKEAPIAREVLRLLEQAIDANYASADWSVLARLAKADQGTGHSNQSLTRVSATSNQESAHSRDRK